MVFDKKKFIGKFVEEAKEHIDMLNDGVLALESNPNDLEAMNQAFRSAHTIKGTSHILSLNEISEVAHKLEDALGALRDRKIQTSKALFNVLFKAVDILNEMTDRVKEDNPIVTNVESICEELGQAVSGGLGENVEQSKSTSSIDHSTQNNREDMTSGAPPQEFTSSSNDGIDAKETRPQEVGDETISSSSFSLQMETQEEEKAYGPGSEQQNELFSNPNDPTPTPTPNLRSQNTIRIDTDKIDNTVKLTGEIISIHARMRQNCTALEDFEKRFQHFTNFILKPENKNQPKKNGLKEKIAKEARKLVSDLKELEVNTEETLNTHGLLTNDLRDKVLGMRMMPLSTVFRAFPRMVRDLSEKHEKQVTLIIEGGETELDKKMIEKISDPLVHTIRNCFDHGIEMPNRRIQLGKAPEGTIKISACYEGGCVLLEVSDDGGGIPINEIKERALKKKLFDKDSLDRMSNAEIINFIFRPGFSTSPIITDISGRGIGMDVVRENIVEHLKGSIQIESVENNGTKFLIRLPLTLAIMPVLLVSVSNETFAIAVNSVDQILRVPEREIIDVVNKKAIRHHEQLIPVVRLAKVLQLPENNKMNSDDVLVLLVYIGGEKLGLIIDSLIKEESVEILSLPRHLEHLDLVAGATLAGKEEVTTLLNITQVIALGKKIEETRHTEQHREKRKKTHHILVVDDSINTREIEKSILESYGYQVDLAVDGIDGFAKAKETQYDLIITDIEMPRLDGFSLTEKLRQEEDYKSTPIIIVTSRDREEDKRHGIKVGADAYIVKGNFDQSNLLSTVQNLIG